MEVPLTPLEFMRRTRRLYASREGVVDGAQRWTYGAFFDRCDRWSAALQRLGVRPGDRVAYIAPNTHAQLESFYAVPQLGAVLVPLNFRLVADDFRYLIQHSGATVVCVSAAYQASIDAIRDDLSNVAHFVALDSHGHGPGPRWLQYESLIEEATGDFVRPAIAENDLLAINYTSGTTSRPKGVMITHRNAWVNSVGMLAHTPMTTADCYLWTLPMFHANGWTFTWTVTAAGARHVCLPQFDAATVFRLAKQEQVTRLCAAPTVLIMLANAPAEAKQGAPRGLGVMTAGAPPAAVTIQRIEDELGWVVTQIYGLTETAPAISICEPRPEHAVLSGDERARIKARQGVELITSGELRVVDDQGREVPADGKSPGEIIARGNVVMAGYYNDPEATAACMGNGWFHTGDAAVVHPDGYVQITDRLKDVIISGGENISSVEVEALLLRHEAVQEVAVVGVPDETWGESPHAFVVFKAGRSATAEQLQAFCREHLAHFKVPHGFTPVAELPKTATGKIQKFVLRQGRPNLSAQ
ncbi:Long-chain-fatty-acid--CoA ligase [Luteitalea pratensis]|uniref:Long-chain-fatty-acid--CoA ligase n=1 Tax=Luteitalea pratensis TaxID=1855912 RepID=A0A143PIS6_LUTPR|nr:long-chain-fatty-acid--CoA ligase [Luteitalea pratensis]AMY08153.1 Long-chain-fatty-acid--CoA ligase [Luteitalea pratensis]